jgi:hypothetical protein
VAINKLFSFHELLFWIDFDGNLILELSKMGDFEDNELCSVLKDGNIIKTPSLAINLPLPTCIRHHMKAGRIFSPPYAILALPLLNNHSPVRCESRVSKFKQCSR